MAFKILRHDQDGATGMLKFTVQVIHGEDVGDTETVAIYPRALNLIHGEGEQTKESLAKAIERWLTPIHEAAIERHRAKRLAGAAGDSVVGKVMEF